MREAILLVLALLAASQGLPADLKVADDSELVVRLDGNGYRDVVVALRDDLDERDCKVFVDAIQVSVCPGGSQVSAFYYLEG